MGKSYPQDVKRGRHGGNAESMSWNKKEASVISEMLSGDKDR